MVIVIEHCRRLAGFLVATIMMNAIRIRVMVMHMVAKMM